MIDLHAHSTFSDGSFTPVQLLEEAERLNLRALALTDHDTMAGLPGFLDAARGRKVRAIPGVEISVHFDPGCMHIVGLFVEPHGRLERQLSALRAGREKRNEEMRKRLAELGCPMEMEEVRMWSRGEVVARPHFAQAMVKRGYVPDVDAAFEQFLGDGKPGHLERFRFLPEESIQAIHAAGGLAILAHPVSLRVNATTLRAEVRKLKEAGLDGIEAYGPRLAAEMTRKCISLSKELGLLVSGGSDFHGTFKPHIRLGRGLGRLRVPVHLLEKMDAVLAERGTRPPQG